MTSAIRLYAAGDPSNHGTITITDTTTNTVIFTHSYGNELPWGDGTISVDFTLEQSMHDLTIYLDMHAYGYVNEYGAAEAGLAQNGWTFTYY